MRIEQGGGPPDTDAIRAARINVRYHIAYIGWLVRTRDWLAGDRMTLADLAAAAHLSAVDYLGDVPWSEDEASKNWYARVKSRPSFRPILAETWPGLAPAPALRESRLLSEPAAISATLIAKPRAKRIGFDVVGVARPDAAPLSKERLEQFLAEGAHGDMIWMETTAERRGDPRALWPEVRSVIMLGIELRPGPRSAGDPEAPRPRRDLGLCQGRGLSRDHQAAAEGDRALADRARPAAT